MNSTICTLFEGDYHFGLGALVNSLYQHGFRGTIWAGYRGNLPPWATPVTQANGFLKFQVETDLRIHFLEIRTTYHFSNYKPQFMLDLWEKHCPDSEALYYFDPDIVIKTRWAKFEEWVSYGIALCEDVSSPIPDSHPRRMGWRRLYEPVGFEFVRKTDIYVNGGFVGVTAAQKRFLQSWLEALEFAGPLVGGLENVSFGQHPKTHNDQFHMFDKEDQDALNIALMCSPYCVSLIGKEGMEIKLGDSMMSHALGNIKPWRKCYTISALRGKSPSWADRSYWKYTQKPIQLYSSTKFHIKRIDLLIGKFISRLLG